MEVFQVGMSQGISYVDSFIRVEGQKLFKKIDGLRIGKGEEFVEVFSVFLVFGKIFDEFLTFFRDMIHVFKIRSSQVLADEFDLIFSVSPREERFSLKHFCKDASNTPHID